MSIAGMCFSDSCDAPGLLPAEEKFSNLTHAIFKFFWWQIWVSFHMQVPAI
jgi:hypothetical protein